MTTKPQTAGNNYPIVKLQTWQKQSAACEYSIRKDADKVREAF